MSREIDILIAEHVFQQQTGMSPLGTLCYQYSEGSGELPHYSKNILSAWEVVEEMNKRGYMFNLCNHHDKLYSCGFGDKSKIATEESPWIHCKSDNPAEVICKGALRFLGINYEEND